MNNRMVRVVLVLLLGSASLSLAFAQNNTFSKDYGPTEDWEAVDTPSTLSQFVYHDNNDNGIYDLGDKAMSTVKVALDLIDSEGNAKRIYKDDTNGNGFANFRTSATRTSAVIQQAGSYRFSVQIPPGWHVTSANAEQTVEIVSRPSTRSQLFLLDYLVPVGLAPDKWIAGTLDAEAIDLHTIEDESDRDQAYPLTLKNSDGDVVQTQQLRASESFRFNVEQGDYVLEFREVSREVTVRHLPVYIGRLQDNHTVGSHIKTATFEDLPEHGIYKVPAGYLGIKWKDINALRRDFSQGTNEGYVNGVTSGKRVAYTSQARHGQILSEQPFDFVSVNLTSGWRAAEGQEVLIEMWRGDQQVAADRLRLSILGPIKYAPNMTDVTRVQFSPMHGWQAVFDDLTIARCFSIVCKIQRRLN